MVTYNDIYIEDIDGQALDTAKVGYIDHTDATATARGYTTTGVKKIYLQGSKASYDVGVFTQIATQPGKPAGNYETTLAYGDFLGHANPTIRVEGVIDLSIWDNTTGNAPTTGSGSDMAEIVTVKLLQQIFRSGHVFRLTDVYDSDPTNDIYRLSSLTGELNAEVISAVTIRCSGLSIRTNATDSKESTKILYSVIFNEVRDG